MSRVYPDKDLSDSSDDDDDELAVTDFASVPKMSHMSPPAPDIDLSDSPTTNTVNSTTCHEKPPVVFSAPVRGPTVCIASKTISMTDVPPVPRVYPDKGLSDSSEDEDFLPANDFAYKLPMSHMSPPATDVDLPDSAEDEYRLPVIDFASVLPIANDVAAMTFDRDDFRAQLCVLPPAQS